MCADQGQNCMEKKARKELDDHYCILCLSKASYLPMHTPHAGATGDALRLCVVALFNWCINSGQSEINCRAQAFNQCLLG